MTGVSQTLDFWMRQLDFLNADNPAVAIGIIKEIRDTSGYPVFTPAEINDYIKKIDGIAPVTLSSGPTPTLVEVLAPVKTPEDLPSLIDKLDNPIITHEGQHPPLFYVEQSAMKTLKEAWDAAQNNNLDIGLALVNVNAGRFTDYILPVRQQIARSLIEKKLTTLSSVQPNADESLDSYIERVLNALYSKKDYTALKSAIDTCLKGTTPYTSISKAYDRDLKAIEKYLTIQYYLDAGDIVAAVELCREVMELSELRFSIIDDCSKILAKIKQEHPDIVASADLIQVNDLRKIRISLDTLNTNIQMRKQNR